MTLLERDSNAPQAWQGDMPVTSRYTYGLAGERFFRALKDEGRIMGTRCEKCAHTYVPAVMFCERCMAELDSWVDVGTQGVVHTFTHLYLNPDGSRRESPEVAAFVRMGDGGLVQRLGDVAPEQVEIGMVVEAVFKPSSDREGAITDIAYFRPV